MDTPTSEETYHVDSQLLIIIINLVFRLKRDCYLCDIVLLLYSFFMYSKFTADIPTFIISEAAMIVFLGFIQFTILSAKSKFVNRMAIEIGFTDTHIYIVTAAFDGPLWFKKASREFKLKRSETTITQVTNPYQGIFKDNKQITLLKTNDEEVFVINGHFSSRLDIEMRPLM